MAFTGQVLCTSPATCKEFIKRLFLSGRGRDALAQLWAGQQTVKAMSDMLNACAIFGPIPHEQIPQHPVESDKAMAAQWFETAVVPSGELALVASRASADPAETLVYVVVPFVREIARRCFLERHGHKAELRRIVDEGFLIDALPPAADVQVRIQDWTEYFVFGGVLSIQNDELKVAPLMYRSFGIDRETLREFLDSDRSEALPFVDPLAEAATKPPPQKEGVSSWVVCTRSFFGGPIGQAQPVGGEE